MISTRTRQVNRISSDARIDTSRAINFFFNGKRYQGYQGDTLASALLANGVKVVGRSFKYSRPRGIVGHGAEEPNAIVQINSGRLTIPNLKATQIELYEGLEANSVNGWPSVEFDLMSIFGCFRRMMPPGFYYKTFMYPAKFWMLYEKFIRKAAGLGRSPSQFDPDIYDKLNQHTDILVIGAGPSGMLAAREAARAGARVIIVDEQNEFGGSMLASSKTIDGLKASSWIEKVVGELKKNKNVLMLSRSTAFGFYDHNFVAVTERRTDHLGASAPGLCRERIHRVRAKQVILATGALERPLVFAHNDIPGVMQASSVSAYIIRYGVAPGNRLLLFTNNDNAYQSAIDWHRAGRQVVAIVDSRRNLRGTMYETVCALGINVKSGHAVIEAEGGKRVKSARIALLSAQGTEIEGRAESVDCDLIACSGGWSPAIHLSSHTGSKPVWDESICGFVPGPTKENILSVGACNGEYSLSGCLSNAAETGLSAAESAGYRISSFEVPYFQVEEPEVHPQEAIFLIPHDKGISRAPSQFVDMQLDVTADSIEIAVREGFESVEHIKRYTALGFGTDQGKLSNVNGIGILAKMLGRSISEIGTTVFRPAYTPTTFGAIAGRDVGNLFDPERLTAIHRWHEENGAKFEDVGQWKRPWFYPRGSESMEEAVNRECMSVRNGVGILDASTLGKIDIQGPDAAEFLTRVYTNSFLNLAPGKCRYGVMLKEDGMIFDDGVCTCLGSNHYLMFTTTGGAAKVLSWLELWRQTEWPELKVYFTSVTDHWGTITVNGPDARKVLQQVCVGTNLDNDSFPFMEWRDAVVAGVDARIFRISFTGELSFEINVPAHYSRHVWEVLIDAGESFDITPYGTEAMHVLRAEKGFMIVGQDTDGSMTPHDMGMGWVVNKSKEFSFIGKRSLDRSDMLRKNRKQFVGLKTIESSKMLPEGGQLVFDSNDKIPMSMQGHVTSSYYSPILGYPIALGVVKGGFGRMGQIVYCPLADGNSIPAEIVSAVFYDSDGARQNVE